MKKAIRLVALCLVLVMAVATLASCGGPSGKYSRTDLGIESYWEFDGDKVSFSAFGITVSDGTYEIEDEQIKVTYTIAGIESTVSYSYKLDGDTLTINKIQYTKAD